MSITPSSLSLFPLFLFSFFLSLFSPPISASLSPCHYDDDNSGAHFQLGMMTKRGGDSSDCAHADSAYKCSLYRVQDESLSRTRNFTYIFNVCGNIPPPLISCGKEHAPAWQVTDTGDCYRLGSTPANSTWSLVEKKDPSLGVSLTYLSGDTCSTGQRRSLTIQFLCADAFDMIPDSKVVEDDCRYMVTFYTAWGCPTECPVSGGELCGQNGFCGYDSHQQKVKCFCYEGWGADDCNSRASHSEGCRSGVCLALAFMVVLLSLLVLAGLFQYYRLHKLSQLNITFAALTESFVENDTGHSATRSHVPSASEEQAVEMRTTKKSGKKFEIGSEAEDL